MILTVKKSRIKGKVEAPSSKSLTHRALLAGIQAEGKTRILNPLDCDDTQASVEAATALGAKINRNAGSFVVEKCIGKIEKEKLINCRDSGTTMRLFLPLCSQSNKGIFLTGNKSLLSRPIGDLLSAVNSLGGKCTSLQNNNLAPVLIKPSHLKGGNISIKGNISSQFISGLLFACPNAENNTTINVSTAAESIPYIELTLKVLREFGIKVDVINDFRRFEIPAKQKFKAKNFTVEGDFSSAAFLLSAAVLKGKVKISNLNKNSLQADKKIVEILKDMNAKIKFKNNAVKAEESELNAVDIDAKHCPDLVPILAVLASQAKGKTKIFNAERLKIKESNRLKAISSELKKMNANIRNTKNGLVIKGPTKLKGTIINPYNDHRIAMGSAIAGMLTKKTLIKNSECISKSFPDFVKAIKNLGVDAVETA
ncbi:3-phosphoshikimate 1-carboxyvinyltransferase [Candidatus Micrarchaeota archaeon]|nr:3-phosphoshikimate 1-carboxyvinyltransferase [Candidatus Micrarchaeota archaeon]MBU2477348.1 3-phosphoshikimate 1-carboxyvinyltransferase [Candidatus Micrarchaeota archaeon]